MKKFIIGFFAILATLAMIGCNNGGAAGISEEDLLGNWLYVESTEGTTQNGTVVYIFKDDGKLYYVPASFLGEDNQADYETEGGTYTTSTATLLTVDYDLSMTKEDDETYLIFKVSGIQCMKLQKIVDEE